VVDNDEARTSGAPISGVKIPAIRENDESANEEEKISSPPSDRTNDHRSSPVSITSVRSASTVLESEFWEGLEG
jgi:hypothetical protein